MNNNNNNNDIKTLELSSGCFESSCSNNKIMHKLSEMQSQNDLDQNKTSENVTSLLSADMKNVKDGNPSVRENSLNNGDDASGQEMYDQNSWVLYGDVSAKNSWVLYGTSDTYLCNGPGEGLEMDQKENVKGDDCDVNVANHLAKDGDPACENLFNQSRPHACSVCCKRFKLSHHLKEHMRIHTGEKPFPCAVCGDRFSRSHLLRAHQARHAQESFPSVGTIFPCSKCMKIFESPQHLARHEKNHVLWKCESCGKQFTHLLLLKRHKQLKHSAAPDSELCSEKVIKQEATDPDESSSRKENPNEAVRDFHGVSNKAAGPSSSENKSLSKNKINSRVTLANEYISKPSVSSEPKMVYDQNSWVLYGEKSNAELPVSTVKEEPQTFNSGLDIAGSSSVYKGIDLAKLHELYLASNRSLFNRNGFLSPFYGLAGFNRHTLMSLMNHAAMNNMLPLSYPAGQSVKTESPLAEGSRPHQCPHCAKRFKLSHHLREHLRIHTGEKPYRCDLCQERFSRSHLLQRHKTKHISDFAFHRVTDWIQQNSADRTVNSYSDHFSPPQQPSTQTEIPNSLLNNQQTKSKITYLQNKNHEEVVKSTTSNLGPERALNQDDENQTKTGKLSNISNADVVQGVTTKDNSDVKISGKNSTNSIYGMSKVGHKPHSIAGCSRTFQTSTPSGNSENGDIGQTDHSLNSCRLENKISESRDDELKTNLRAYSDARHPGKDSSSDSSEDNWETSQQTKSKTVSNQSNTNHLLNLSGNDRIINKVRTRQLRKLADPKKRNKDIHENNREMIALKNIKSEGDISEPTSETKPSSELPSANYPSHFQLNQSLLNNNINLINTGYFNYTQNLQQAIKIGAFRSFNNSNATGLEHPQEAFLSPLDYSNFFRTRPGGFMRCEFCGKWFSDMNNLRQHMVSHSLDRHFSCRQCEKKFKRPHHLKEHMRIHTGEKPYICDICDEKFSRSHILQRHRSKHDTQLLSDSYVQNVLHNICDQRARSPEFVYDKYCSQDLIKGDSGAQPGPASSDSDSDNKPSVESEGMDTDATNRKSQSTELRSYLHDPNLMQAFACQECGKKFANSSNLKQHMVSHFPDRLFSCSVCSKKFKRPHHLKEHSRTHTGEKPFQCRRCGERFQRSHLLMKHKEKHHSCFSNSSADPSSATTTFEASDAKVNGYLNDQTVDDTSKIQSQDGSQNPDTAADCDRGDQSGGEAVFCNICSKEFPSETALTVHRRTHPGDRPHQCGNCGKQFALQYLLEVHEKSCSSVSIASS